MKLTVERMPESQVLLDITADEDEFAQAMDRAYRKVSREITLPGFRKGKAPRTMIERMYGREIFLEEANQQIMEDLYRRALQQEELVPVGEPNVEITEMEPISFKVTLPVYPTVEVGPYQDARVEPVDATVDESEVDEVVERLRKSQSPWVDPEEGEMEVGPGQVLERRSRHPREGDQVTIDLAVKEGDEPFQEPAEDAVFVLGESNLFDALRERIETMRVGDTETMTLAFDDDDESVNAAIRGKVLTYTITLKGLKERDLLPLDDEFAKTYADLETMEELRKTIRDDLHQGKTAEARRTVVTEVINTMAETATIDPPAVMIDEMVEEELQSFQQQLAQTRRTLADYLRANDQTEADLREELRPSAARRLRNSMLLREIAKAEGIEVTDDDLDAEIDELARPSSEEENAERLQNLYRSDYFRGILRTDLFERRITNRLIEIATEGRDAVVNGWVPPEPEPVSEGAEVAPAAEDAKAVDDTLTVGVTPGDDAGISEEQEADDKPGEGDVSAHP